MCGVTSGRKEICNSNLGGLKNVYLFNYVNYRKFQIEVNSTNLLSYPTTTIYKFELRADANTFSSDLESNPDGKSYNQTASLTLKGLKKDALEISNLLFKRVGCIVENRLGQFQIMGLFNGVVVKSVKVQSGGSRSDFNGWNISLQAKETKMPLFIDDLEAAGFEQTNNLLQENEDNILQENGDNILLDRLYYLLQENGSYLLEENDNKIIT